MFVKLLFKLFMVLVLLAGMAVESSCASILFQGVIIMGLWNWITVGVVGFFWYFALRDALMIMRDL